MADKGKSSISPPQPEITPLARAAFGIYAAVGLAMALSAFLPYRVITHGNAQITYTGLQFTHNLAWILVACGVIAGALGIIGLLGRKAPPYLVWLPPGTGLIFAGFFLLLFFQASPTLAGQKYVLVTDLNTWEQVRATDVRTVLGLGLIVTTATALVMTVASYPMFRSLRSRRDA